MALQRCTFFIVLDTFKNIFINFSLLPCSGCCLWAGSGLCMLEGSGLEACDKVHVSTHCPITPRWWTRNLPDKAAALLRGPHSAIVTPRRWTRNLQIRPTMLRGPHFATVTPQRWTWNLNVRPAMLRGPNLGISAINQATLCIVFVHFLLQYLLVKWLIVVTHGRGDFNECVIGNFYVRGTGAGNYL
jgi:hypothetical protein